MEIIIPEEAFLKFYRDKGLLKNQHDINLLYGGRDSGKSYFIGQRLLFDCLNLPYFRCLLIKKTYNSIKESQWQTLKDIVEAWGFESLFTFSVAPLAIECINGNRFIARGCEDPQRIKSTKDPSHSWYEEGNQLTLEDFITVTTTLRTNKVKIQQWISFNPECDGDYEDFWLYQTFFKDRNELTFEDIWEMDSDDGGGKLKSQFLYKAVHSTYHNNEHCSITRKVFLEQLKKISPYYYQIYTLGRWGRKKNKSPFVYAYDREKHDGKTKYNPAHELYCSFDFNRNPICASLYQYYGGVLYGIEAIKIEDSNIYELCDTIMRKYPRAIFRITGDATGRASNAMMKDEMSYYKIIKNKMRLSSAQIKVPSINPLIKENQVLVNAVLINVPCIFDKDKCAALLYDFANVRVLADGSIDKGDRNDPTKQADQLDTFRYLCNSFFKWVMKT